MEEVKVKRKRHRIISTVSMTMLDQLPNVQRNGHIMDNVNLRVVVFNAALEYPKWHFNVTQAETCKVFLGQELLVSMYQYNRWSRSGGYTFPVRISAPRVDGMFAHGKAQPGEPPRSKLSSNPAQILRTIRAYVYPQTDKELIQTSTQESISELYGLERNYASHAETNSTHLQNAAVQFVLGKGKEAFLAAEEKQGRDTADTIAQIDIDRSNEKAAELLRKKMGDTLPLIIRKDGGWLVKHKDTVMTYGTDDLPDAYAAVHMLELSLPGTVLSEIGAKVREGRFVLMPQKHV